MTREEHAAKFPQTAAKLAELNEAYKAAQAKKPIKLSLKAAAKEKTRPSPKPVLRAPPPPPTTEQLAAQAKLVEDALLSGEERRKAEETRKANLAFAAGVRGLQRGRR